MPRIDVQQIVSAAWAVVDRGGVGAFKVRTIADELGITAMAIYHHVPSKAALASLMIEAAAGERPMAPPTGEWREDLWLQARWLREMRLAHPAMGAIHREYKTWSATLLKTTERWVNAWCQSGLPAERALIAARASSQAIVGMADEELAYESEAPPRDELLAEAPMVTTMFAKDHCRDRLFELTVRSIIDGLHMRLANDKIDLDKLLAQTA